MSYRASAETLDWQAAVDQARKNNSQLTSARESYEAARLRSNGGYAPFLPKLAGNLSYSRGNTGTARAGGELVTGTDQIRDSYAATIDFDQNLFNGYSDAAALREAKANEAQQKANLDSTRAQVSFDLKSAFSGMKYAQDTTTLADAIVERRRDNMRLVELRFEGGRENKGSVLLSKAALTQAHYEALQARQNLRLAGRELARILGQEGNENLNIRGKVPLSSFNDEPDLRALALDTPAYRQALAQTELADARLGKARARFFPTLDLSGSIGRLDDRFFPENERWSVGLNIRIPLLRGGADYFASRSAARDLSAANAQQTGTAHEALVTLEESRNNLLLAIKKIEVDSDFLKAAEVRAEIARNRYNTGLLTFEDWDLIENDLIQRQKAVLQSERDRVVAEGSWEKALGKGVIE